jgi:large subunit ribosomal protein L18
MKRKEINNIRLRRTRRTRAKIFGTKEKPRLSVYRSNKHISVQLIDDNAFHTLAFASSFEYKGQKINKTEMAKFVGNLIAEKAKKLGIKEVVFDRGWYRYHGRVKALAEAARSAGLKF